MSILYRLTENGLQKIGETSLDDSMLQDVKLKVSMYSEQNFPETKLDLSHKLFFMDLCLALAVYDYCGAPSNWMDFECGGYKETFNHEKIIFKWGCWCVNEYSVDDDELKRLIKQYKKNKVPDCSDLMEEYFT